MNRMNTHMDNKTSPAGHVNPAADKSTSNNLLYLWEQAHKMTCFNEAIRRASTASLLSALGGNKNG